MDIAVSPGMAWFPAAACLTAIVAVAYVQAMQQREEHLEQSYSDVALLVQSLANDGRAAVSLRPSTVDDTDAVPFLRELDALTRDELALELPAFSPDVALWAARLFTHLCRFVVCRDIPEEQIKAACNAACPKQRGPETDWSADLMLRNLPNLFRFARHLSNADPLVGEMKKIAGNWPLSSVGIDGLDALQIDSFVDHDGLRRLYADRIIATGDMSRLSDSRVENMVRADLGVHRELAPAISAKIFETTHDTR